MRKKYLHAGALPFIRRARFSGASGYSMKRIQREGDGGAGAGTATEAETALLNKIGEKVKSELELRKYPDAPAIQGLITEALKGLPMEALRAYNAEDKAKLETTVKNISAELEKVKNIRTGPEMSKKDKGLLKRAFMQTLDGAPAKEGETAKPSEVEMLMRHKKGEVVFNIRAAAIMTTANTIDENDYPDEMIESMNVLDEVVKIRRGTQYIFDIASVTTVAELEQFTTWMEEGDIQGGFAVVDEGGLKPLVSGALVRNFAEARKIAAKTVITEEFAKWRKKAWTALQNLINDKLLRDYAAILTTDLQAQAAGYVGTTLDGTFPAPNKYDAIGAVAAQIETLNFFPDLLIIHPQDKWLLSLQKDSEGRYYMMIPMYTPDGMVQMMGFRVLTSTYQTIGSFTLGESGLFKIEQETISVRLGYGITVTTAIVSATSVVTNVESDVDTNRMRMIVELFFKDYIATNHIGSFVTATFATVQAALQAA